MMQVSIYSKLQIPIQNNCFNESEQEDEAGTCGKIWSHICVPAVQITSHLANCDRDLQDHI